MFIEKTRPVDRRRSPRWPDGKPLRWRLHRGRRIRQSTVIDRSLHGLVLADDLPQQIQIGQQLRPADAQAAQRHGFEHAVVRRLEEDEAGEMRIVAEILA